MNVVPALAIAGLGAVCAGLLVLLWRERRRAPQVGFREVFEAMQEAALVVAPDGTVLEANAAAVRLLGEDDLAAVRGEALLALAPQLETARRARQRSGEPRHLGGDFDGFTASISHITDAKARRSASVVVVHDERSDRVRERGLLSAAHSDPLTGAANRSGFATALQAALRRRDGSATGVVFVDLDAFKPVNDVHGHAIGDAVLTQVVERLRHGMRDGDLVGRLGGDEFALLLREVTPAGLAAVTKRVREAITAPMTFGDLTVRVGASVGVSSAPRDGTTVDALLAAADERMYREKRGKADRGDAATPAVDAAP
jgi:diguanylate cyclase (GGDEF)-like protein